MAKVKEEVVVESPTLEEGKPATEVKAEETPVDDTSALLAELEKAGITKPDELTGKLEASYQAGNLANQLGEARQELAEIKAAMGQPKPTAEEYSGYEETADLEKILERTLDKREKVAARKQAEAQKVVLGMWNKIQNDSDYKLVKEVWEDKLKDPNFTFKIQQGLVNPIEEYNDVVRGYYKGIAKRSLDTIKKLQGGAVPATPHVEDSARLPGSEVPIGEEKSEAQKTVDRLKEITKTRTLTEEEELEAIDAALKL